MTREHVFAHWLVRRVHGGRLVASDRAATLASFPAGTPSTDAPLRVARTIAAGVCAECNAGWMSTLEVSFRQAAFARPRVGMLHAPDRLTIARWFTKTAVLLAHARGGALVTAAHRAQIVTGMPDDIEVFAARRRRPPQRLDYVLDMTGEPHAMRVRSVSILVDDIVGHVALRGTLTSRHGTKLWPLRTHTLRWETLPVVTSLAQTARESTTLSRSRPESRRAGR